MLLSNIRMIVSLHFVTILQCAFFHLSLYSVRSPFYWWQIHWVWNAKWLWIFRDNIFLWIFASVSVAPRPQISFFVLFLISLCSFENLKLFGLVHEYINISIVFAMEEESKTLPLPNEPQDSPNQSHESSSSPDEEPLAKRVKVCQNVTTLLRDHFLSTHTSAVPRMLISWFSNYPICEKSSIWKRG